jgi:hypothetical protein
MKMPQEDPLIIGHWFLFWLFSNAKQPPPHPQHAPPLQSFSSYPYRFALGQVGQLGQTAKTIANRAFHVSFLHIYAGTALGHAGTLHFQDVSGRVIRAESHTMPASRSVLFRRYACPYQSPGHLSRLARWSGSLGNGAKASQRRNQSGCGA